MGGVDYGGGDRHCDLNGRIPGDQPHRETVAAGELTIRRVVDPGFVADRVVTMRVALPVATYADGARALAFYDGVLDRIRALPGVRAAGATQALPLGGEGAVRPYGIEGGPSAGDRPVANYRIVD